VTNDAECERRFVNAHLMKSGVRHLLAVGR
jgi:hypothetical protein